MLRVWRENINEEGWPLAIWRKQICLQIARVLVGDGQKEEMEKEPHGTSERKTTRASGNKAGGSDP